MGIQPVGEGQPRSTEAPSPHRPVMKTYWGRWMTPIPPAQPGEVGTVINGIYGGEARVLERLRGLPMVSQLPAGVGTGLGAGLTPGPGLHDWAKRLPWALARGSRPPRSASVKQWHMNTTSAGQAGGSSCCQGAPRGLRGPGRHPHCRPGSAPQSPPARNWLSRPASQWLLLGRAHSCPRNISFCSHSTQKTQRLLCAQVLSSDGPGTGSPREPWGQASLVEQLREGGPWTRDH